MGIATGGRTAAEIRHRQVLVDDATTESGEELAPRTTMLRSLRSSYGNRDGVLRLGGIAWLLLVVALAAISASFGYEVCRRCPLACPQVDD